MSIARSGPVEPVQDCRVRSRHSRAGGNPGLFPAAAPLDTRFRGYDRTGPFCLADRASHLFRKGVVRC
jgi:hypothetical protein